jgi:hypothetical protein
VAGDAADSPFPPQISDTAAVDSSAASPPPVMLTSPEHSR